MIGLWLILVVPPVLGAFAPQFVALVPIAFVILVARALFRGPRSQRWLVRALGLYVLGRLIPLPGSAVVVYEALGSVLLATTTWTVIARAMASGSVTPNRLFAAIAGYLLIGLTFGSVFVMVETLLPQAFSVGDTAPATAADLNYYSLVTLSTVGYGDITPQDPIARALSVTEALAGQVYLTVLVGRLVGLHLAETSKP